MDYLKTTALKVITVDSQCQQQKCSAWTLVSGDVRFMRIFAGLSNCYVNFRYACVHICINAVLVKDRLTRTLSALCHLRIVPKTTPLNITATVNKISTAYD